MSQDSEISRAYIHVDDRLWHYRFVGSGPVLVMLHQSPQNSRMWLEPMRRFSRNCTVIAPDMPGYGWTEPFVDDSIALADFSAAIHRFLDALGVDRCVVFGMHTGGLVAMHMGLDRPERITAVIVDGLASFTPEERRLLDDRYLPPFEPTWDGAHLRWLWARMREQVFFFPWYESRKDFALDFPPPDAARTQSMVDDILECGDAYRIGYRAALTFADRHRVAELSVPTWLLYRLDDVLATHMERLPQLPDHVLAEHCEDRESLWQRMDTILNDLDGSEGVALPVVEDSVVRRRVESTSAGDLAVWILGDAGPMTIELHGIGQAPAIPKWRADDAGRRLLVDLPGHGGSSESLVAGLDVMQVSRALIELADRFAPGEKLNIKAHAGSAALAVDLAERIGPRCRELALIDPWLFSEREKECFMASLPDLSLQRAGGHLLEAWQWERERHFFPPWLAARPENRIREDGPDPHHIHANTTAMIFLGPELIGLFDRFIQPGLTERIEALDCAVDMRIN